MSDEKSKNFGTFLLPTAILKRSLLAWKGPSLLVSWRFLMAIFLFLGYMLNYMQKIDMSIAIICMINQTAINLRHKSLPTINVDESNESSTSDFGTNHSKDLKCHLEHHHSQHFDGPFVWDKSIQGLILSAYFYGYILLQLPGGWLSFRFGGKLILAVSMGVGSVITILIPFCARIHYWALIVCLFFTGAAHGSFWPAVSSFWAYWAPDAERSRLVGFASSGAKVGNIVALSLGGVLCLHGIDDGWPSIFYLFGSLGVLWAILFLILGADSPEKQRFISEKERNYILKETEKTIALRKFCQKHVPWKQMFTSKAVYSIIIGHFSHGWGGYLFLMQIPSFLKDVLKFDIKSNGFVSSIPYVVSGLAINLSSVAADKLLKRTKLSRTLVRRLFSMFGQFSSAITILLLSFVDCTHVVWGVVLLTLSVGFDSILMGGGYLININDIAGPYSGIIFGISNTAATLTGIISPYMASAITKHGYPSEWQKVFIIAAVVYCIGGVFSVALLDANIQPWAKIDENLKANSDSSSSNATITSENNSKGGSEDVQMAPNGGQNEKVKVENL